MYKEIKSRRLALLVAIALTGGSLAGATNAYAAEVTGQNVTINASNRPSNNATDPYGNTGSAAGAINDPANGDDVSGNTLTLADYDYSGNNIFGGFTRGTGRAKDNIVHIRENGKVEAAYGGVTYSGGDAVGNRVYLHAGGLVNGGVFGGSVDGASGSAEDNHVVVESGRVNDFIRGGNIDDPASTDHVTGNTVTIAGGVIDAPVYGGYTNGSGNVTGNRVTITGGEIHGSVIGGDTFGSGNVTGNTVTITGGEIHRFVFGGAGHESANVTGNTVTITGGEIRDHVYGGFTYGDGDVTGNIVNIGDGAHDLAAGTRIQQSIYGGSNDGGSGTISGNTLNVKASASAQNIHNFDTINFHFTDTLSPKLTLSDTAGTTINRLSDISVNGLPTAVTGTLIEKTAGTITVSDGPSSVTTTGDTAETTLSTDTTRKKIDYTRYIFKGARTAESSSFHETWGGRSVIGNTTTDNVITVSSGTHTDVYGGWTRGASSQTATADKGNSTDNKVTVDGTATVSGVVYGGVTTVEDGKASNNEVTINGGTLNGIGDVYGGSAADASSADKNKVYLNGIDTPGNVYGGSTGLGTANGNEVHLNGATVTRSVFGGSGDSTSKNKVYLLNGAQVTGSVYGGGGWTANDNEVHLNGATVTGPVYGGAAAGTGNLLSVKGVNSAGWIAGFQKVTFDATGVAADETMLNLNGSAGTTLDRGAIDATGSTVNGGITLLHNANGITLIGYTDGLLKSETDATTEKNISVHKTGSNITDIRYEGYQFAGVTTPVIIGTDAYGGISKAGNATHTNHITVNGNYTNVYGGHTSGAGTTRDDKDNSYRNSVTITGGTLGNVYGGYTESATGTTTGNTVNIGDGTNALTAGTTIAEIHGGNRTAQGNKLVVNTAATVGKVLSFEKFIFNHTASAGTTPMLTITNGATDLDFNAIEATDAATENPVTLVHNSAGLNLTNYDAAKVKSTLNEAGTQETNIDVRKTGALNTDVIRYAYTFAGATAATTVGSDTWGGRSVAGNTTTGNTITVENGAHTNVYGGWTTGTGSTAAADKLGDSTGNKVTVNGSATVSGTVYGGYTDALGGKATGNEVTIDKVSAGSVVGGYGAITNDNVINLRNATVGGTVTGGTAANGTGNTLAVYYGTGTTSIGDFSGIQNLHFDLENAPTDGTAHTLLNLTNAAGEKSFSNINLDIHRSGATKKLRKGDSFTLVDNTTAGGSVSIGDNVTAEGTDGVTRKYTFAVAQDPNDAHKLVATVTKAGLGEQAKSLVETRAGASAFLNDGADFLAGAGMSAAQKEAAAAAMTSGGVYGLWAGMGGGSLRHETGSYVDMTGWNLGVGWARENAVKAGTLTFGPFIEYGRGSYDSYLDDGTHGSGKTSYVGVGMMAKLETKANSWIDGALRVGRTKSDYTGLDTGYDTTSTYYAMHVGVGKDFRVREGDTVSAYVRYSYAHTAGASAHLSSGETYDFDAVNSHRLRIGTRYTHGETALSQLYAGLAWEYELDGDARATYDGDSTPSPSLKGGSALLELGYRFAPKADSRVSYDLNLSGWQGKRQGVTGGVSVKWAF